jgi:hypothetical protein
MNRSYQADRFETQKNLKASGYTLMICILLAIILLFATWTLPPQPAPIIEDGIEVNLGNSDLGLGDKQPYLPGKPSPQDQEKYTPPKQSAVVHEAAKDVETDDKETDAPAVKKPAVTKPNATKIPDKEPAKAKQIKVVQPVVNPTPIPPKPKAVFHGVNGTDKGGNDADNYKPGGNQGIAGGKGDQGQPGGNPNSNNYTGGGKGNSGVTISRGLQGRKWISLPSFTDEFNDNAKVAMDIHVDGNGNVTEAEYQPRGSTTSDASMKAIAGRKAKQIKFNSTGEESVGTIIFNFRIKN